MNSKKEMKEKIMSNKECAVEKVLTENETWYKFLRLPAEIASKLTHKKGRLIFNINQDKVRLLYLPEYRKVCGLTYWYRKYNLKKGDKVEIKVISKRCNIFIKKQVH